MIRLAAACSLLVVASWAATRPTETEDHHAPHAGCAIRMDVREMARRADLVFEGQVVDAHTIEAPDGLIVTDFLIEIDRTQLGEPLAARTVRLPGGVLEDGRGMMVPGMATLQPGEDVLLFLARESATGMRTVMGLSQGKFRIEEAPGGGRRLARGADAAHGHHGDEHFDYAQVQAEIRAGIAQREGE